MAIGAVERPVTIYAPNKEQMELGTASKSRNLTSVVRISREVDHERGM